MNIIKEPIQLIYYMVFVTRYKRSIFDESAATLIKSTLLNIQGKGILKIENLKVENCYISLTCQCESTKSPNQIVSVLKRACFQAMLEKNPHLNSLWAREVIIKTTPTSKMDINEFLHSIKRRG